MRKIVLINGAGPHVRRFLGPQLHSKVEMDYKRKDRLNKYATNKMK